MKTMYVGMGLSHRWLLDHSIDDAIVIGVDHMLEGVDCTGGTWRWEWANAPTREAVEVFLYVDLEGVE